MLRTEYGEQSNQVVFFEVTDILKLAEMNGILLHVLVSPVKPKLDLKSLWFKASYHQKTFLRPERKTFFLGIDAPAPQPQRFDAVVVVIFSGDPSA